MIYNIQRGDICVLPFPFTDLTGQKKRPALALSSADEFGDIVFETSLKDIKIAKTRYSAIANEEKS